MANLIFSSDACSIYGPGARCQMDPQSYILVSPVLVNATYKCLCNNNSGKQYFSYRNSDTFQNDQKNCDLETFMDQEKFLIRVSCFELYKQ